MSDEKVGVYLSKDELKEIFYALGAREQLLVSLNFITEKGILSTARRVWDLRARIGSEISAFDSVSEEK